MVEDRLSRAGDSDVYPVDAMPAVPADPVSVDLDVSVFTVACSGSALAGILRGMSHWQFPVLLMLRTTSATAVLKHEVARSRIENVAGVAISCCDGEAILVSR